VTARIHLRHPERSEGSPAFGIAPSFGVPRVALDDVRVEQIRNN